MSAALLAITRVDVADYVSTLITVYIVLIFIRILMSWFTRIPYNRYLAMVLKFVSDVTDPYLNLFRRFIPPLRIGGGGLDLSPMLGIALLYVARTVVVALID
jgi:uncharacterized protein YggT (Ycf19 family)